MISEWSQNKNLPSAHDIKDNCKLAFEAAEKLGVARLIEPSDMVATFLLLLLFSYMPAIFLLFLSDPDPIIVYPCQ